MCIRDRGDASRYAAPYEDLGIDADAKIKSSEIAQYAVDIGTNPDGKVVALGYQATGGAFIYRRSIAKDTWGTDDPKEIGAKLGAGTNDWTQFFNAAEELKGKGYGIVSGDGDIWHAVENSSDNCLLYTSYPEQRSDRISGRRGKTWMLPLSPESM